jgi:ABC-type multidrug transport system ATPase subunit
VIESNPSYDDLQLRIERGEGASYRVLATASDGRTARSTFETPITDDELDDFVRRVGLLRRRGRSDLQRMAAIESLGSKLFNSLIKDDVQSMYQAARGAAQEHDRGLRITLQLSDAAELMRLPWEFLYSRPRFLSQSTFTPVVRSLDLATRRRPLKVKLPLKILGMVSSPTDYEGLDADVEREKLEGALRPLTSERLVELQWLERATLAELSRKMAQPDEIHILHYIGHGSYDEANEEGILVLEDRRGRADDVPGATVGAMLQNKRSLRLVVLNSCEGARTSCIDPFSGVATKLIEFDIPAVIGMQFEITNEAAIAFSESLYSALAHSLPVDAALGPARLAILAEREAEFGTPVLFLRAADARLFDLPSGPAQMPPTLPTPEPGNIQPDVSAARLDLSEDPQWADALSARLAKRWPEAVDRFEALRARYPTDDRVLAQLQQARRARDIDEWSSRADAAAAEGDWDAAVLALVKLTALDPAYPDAGARLDQALAQRLRTQDDETTAHQAGRWDADSAAARESDRHDLPTDPRGFSTDAMMAKIGEAEILDRYAQALSHLDQENWQQAAELLTAIEQEHPSFREAAVLLKTVQFAMAKAAAEPPHLGGLVVDSVQFKVNGIQLLDNISLIARPGSLTAVLGGSGVGKSTLVRLIAGYTRPNSGTVTFEGHDVHREYAALRRRIGVVPQDDTVHRQLTIRQELGYAAELRLPPDTSKADRAKVVAQVLEELDLTTRADKRVDTLSGGQRKRASIALELLTLALPTLLILDEPTVGLDPAMDRQVMTMLRQLADSGRVVLVVTDWLSYLDVCDQVLLLAPGGKTAFYGPPDQIGPAMGTTNWADIFSSLASDPDAAQAMHLARTSPTPPPPPAEKPVELEDLPQTSLLRQFSTFARRQIRLIVSDRGYFIFLMLLPFIMGSLSLAVPGNVGLGLPVPAIEGGQASNEPGLILVLLNVGAVFMGTALTIRALIGERAIFLREQALGLSTSAYLLAKVCVFTVFAVLQSAILVAIAVIGKGWGHGAVTSGTMIGSRTLELYIDVAATCVAAAMVGLALSALARSNNQILPLLVVATIAQLVFSGGMIAVTDKPLDVLAWFTPARWGFASTASTIDLRGLVPPPLTPQDSHWQHTAGAWLFDMGMLAVLSAAYAGFVWWRIGRRRH